MARLGSESDPFGLLAVLAEYEAEEAAEQKAAVTRARVDGSQNVDGSITECGRIHHRRRIHHQKEDTSQNVDGSSPQVKRKSKFEELWTKFTGKTGDPRVHSDQDPQRTARRGRGKKRKAPVDQEPRTAATGANATALGPSRHWPSQPQQQPQAPDQERLTFVGTQVEDERVLSDNTQKGSNLEEVEPALEPTAEPSAAPPLPPGWAEAVDAGGKVYYWALVSREVTWNRPTAAAAVPPLPPGWVEAVAPSGKIYYCEKISREVTWKRPTAASAVPALPPGWARGLAPNGKVYHWEKATGKATWTHPTAAEAAAAATQQRPKPDAAEVFQGRSIPGPQQFRQNFQSLWQQNWPSAAPALPAQQKWSSAAEVVPPPSRPRPPPALLTSPLRVDHDPGAASIQVTALQGSKEEAYAMSSSMAAAVERSFNSTFEEDEGDVGKDEEGHFRIEGEAGDDWADHADGDEWDGDEMDDDSDAAILNSAALRAGKGSTKTHKRAAARRRVKDRNKNK